MAYSTGGTLALLIQNAIFYGLIIAPFITVFHQKKKNSNIFSNAKPFFKAINSPKLARSHFNLSLRSRYLGEIFRHHRSDMRCNDDSDKFSVVFRRGMAYKVDKRQFVCTTGNCRAKNTYKMFVSALQPENNENEAAQQSRESRR